MNVGCQSMGRAWQVTKSQDAYQGCIQDFGSGGQIWQMKNIGGGKALDANYSKLRGSGGA